MKQYVAMEMKMPTEIFDETGKKVWPPEMTATEIEIYQPIRKGLLAECKTRVGEILVNIGGNLINGF